MNEFNELESTNQYLVDALILARNANDILIENNRRLERLLIKTIKDLQECNRYFKEMQCQVGELATIALDRVKKGAK
jgi:hypothetical protein